MAKIDGVKSELGMNPPSKRKTPGKQTIGSTATFHQSIPTQNKDTTPKPVKFPYNSD